MPLIRDYRSQIKQAECNSCNLFSNFSNNLSPNQWWISTNHTTIFVRIGKIFGKMGIISHRYSLFKLCNKYLIKKLITNKRMRRQLKLINRHQINWNHRIQRIRDPNKRKSGNINVIFMVARLLSGIGTSWNYISWHTL